MNRALTKLTATVKQLQAPAGSTTLLLPGAGAKSPCYIHEKQ
jgi:hypothetical protein